MDFWRGVALAVILVNHIPGNVVGSITPRNFGFSDAAEVFVFLSGVSVYFAYGDRFGNRPWLKATASLARRTARLYSAHIALTVAGLVLYWLATRLTSYDFLSVNVWRSTPFQNPMRAIFGILTLGHQIPYFNILPLYIVFMALAPALLVLARRQPVAMLGISGAIYLGTRAAGFNMPNWPEGGVWYFNPFAWQFLFALGILCGRAAREREIPFDRGVYQLSRTFTAIAALVVSNAFGLLPGLVDEAGRFLDWDKTDLGVVRIADFLTLAYWLRFSRLAARIQSAPTFRFFVVMGRNALPVFCLGSLLSAFGQVLTESGPASPFLDILFVVVALALMALCARRIDRGGGASSRETAPSAALTEA